ncbi:Gldg family protein [candidate division KSB1 bacterium]|nr:Gldg family protein [candidate division KSB1 bacterium]
MNIKLGNFELNINTTVILSIVKRDLRMYFNNPTGYVFLTLFIFLSAFAAFWQERFFLNNLANLDQLNGLFPLLLLFFVPALTMGVWANESKEGTDELLLTLPATDFEIAFGKYLATLGVYTASLVLSFIGHFLILAWLGSPDLGLIIGNYFGYWFTGAALIAVGMLASLLTANATIAFVLGAVFCAFFVYIDAITSLISTTLGDWLEPLGVYRHFGDFARGIVSFSGILYFISIAALMLYLNVLLIGRRHWPVEADGYKMWLHHLVRSVAIVIAVISVNAILARAALRLDVTAEQLHSLSDQTEKLLDEIPDDRPVFIEAFISKNVPQIFVQTRANLLGFLKEIDAVAGNKVQVLIHDTEQFSDDARDAREKFGILARDVPNTTGAQTSIDAVFLGVAVKCGAEEQVIPFFDRGLPVEYELTRSIRVVARTQRKKIGVLNTEAKFFGGFDFQTMRSNPSWPVVAELKKQYEVEQVSATSPITEKYDALLVALPSSLPQEEMDNLLTYIEAGHPALLLVDPLTIINIGLSPSERAGSNTNPFMRNQGPPPKEKGNIQGLMTALGVNWNSRQVVWDQYNPHPDFAQLPLEFVFVGANNPEGFNQEHSGSANLQELIFLHPGTLRKAANTSYDFQPLIKSTVASGSLMYSQLVQRSFFGGPQLGRPQFGYRPNPANYTLAAHIKGETIPDTSISTSETPKNVNAIVIADMDFISDQFFQIRQQAIGNLNFDNVSFFLNCMDVLIGDESFIALRNKRVKHRTLESIEGRKSDFKEQQIAEEQQAENEASKALSEAQRRLTEKVNEVRSRADLDERAKDLMAKNLQEVEQRKFDALKENIEADKEAKIQRSKENMESQIRNIQSFIKSLAVILPPLPVFVLGAVIFRRRQKREREGAQAARRLRG